MSIRIAHTSLAKNITFIRQLSQSTRLQAKKEWIVLIYDQPKVDRLKFRDEHLSALKQNIGEHITSAAAMVGPNGKFLGSTLHVKADTREDVLKFLKQDPYAKNEIWDFSNCLIYQILVATRDEKVFK